MEKIQYISPLKETSTLKKYVNKLLDVKDF